MAGIFDDLFGPLFGSLFGKSSGPFQQPINPSALGDAFTAAGLGMIANPAGPFVNAPTVSSLWISSTGISAVSVGASWLPQAHIVDGDGIVWRWGQIEENPSLLTVAMFDRAWNAEIRSAMLRIWPGGIEAFLSQANAKVLDEEPGVGRLFRYWPADAQRRGAEPVTIVEVKNSSPEPDGTFKMYYLRVSPFCATAREAVAWTFEMTEEEYQPVIET